MARIRTIKPEFPQSESIGRLSREARLCFILLWTLADDSGRLRGNSRMLASLLYPYDDDAKQHMDGWIEELERESCAQRYQVDGETYIQICNWLKHQKIDKPSASKIPEIPQPFANPREDSEKNAADQGMDQGPRIKEGNAPQAATRPRKAPKVSLPSNFQISDRVRQWAGKQSFDRLDAHFDYFVSKAKAKGYTYADWDEGFMGAIRDDWAGLRKAQANAKFNVHAYGRKKLAEAMVAGEVGEGSTSEILPALPPEVH